jgi:hypothetical protein
MQQCAEHVAFQLPNEFTRVGYLLDAIENTDAGLQAAIAQVRTDDGAGGKRNDFEATASYLLPYDPVAKKRAAGGKRERATISDTTADVSSTEGFGTKPGIGKTGVHLRYHSKEEYKKLSKEQRLELKEWREKKTENGDGQPPKKRARGDKMSKKQIAAISKAAAKHITQMNKDDEEDDDMNSLIMSLQTKAATTDVTDKTPEKPALAASAKVNTSALKSILRRAKNAN